MDISHKTGTPAAAALADIAQYRVSRVFGGRGRGRGRFFFPHDVAVCPVTQNVLVAEYGNHRVQILDRNFGHIRDVTQTSDGKMSCPSYVTVTSRGEVVISDDDADTVSVHDSSGNHLRNLPDPWNPTRGVAVDNEDNVYVCNSDTIRVVDTTGNHQWTIDGHEQIQGDLWFVTVCGGNLYVTDEVGHLHQMTIHGEYTSQLLWKRPINVMRNACGLAVLEQRVLVVANSRHKSIRLVSNGHVLRQIGKGPGGPGRLNEPRGLAVNASGCIIVANWGNHNLLIIDKE